MRVTALCMEGTLERALGMLLRDEGNKDRVWETLGVRVTRARRGTRPRERRLPLWLSG